MRRVALGALLLASLAARAEEPPRVRGYALAGIGLPSLLHAEGGFVLADWMAVELRAESVVFNLMAGPGVSFFVGRRGQGRPPRHALMLSGATLLNVTRPALVSRGETIGSAIAGEAGYAFLADGGFYLRAVAGGLLLLEGMGPAGGPNFKLSLGYAFGSRD